MDWGQAIVTEKVNEVLNPRNYFPGILLFDENMRLILRGKSKAVLLKARNILEEEK